jgi:siroheme synthase
VRENVRSPAIIIVGDVVLMADAEDRLATIAREMEYLN